MLDADLAELYGVPTKRLNQQVRRNLKRFPPDFMFRLTRADLRTLRLQIATSNGNRGGRRYAPFAFTELGVSMLSSVLHTERAIQVNIGIMRAFVSVRDFLASYKELAQEVYGMEKRCHARHGSLLRAVRKMLAPPDRPRRPIGFTAPARSE